MFELDAVVKEFLVESYENLDQLDRDLVALEKDPRDRQRLSSIFRTIHTIKGTCGFFGFGKLESVTHVGENLLSKLRDGVLHLDADRTSVLLALVDAVRAMLACIEQTGGDGDAEYRPLIQKLTQLQEEEAGNQPGGGPAVTVEAVPSVDSAPSAAPKSVPVVDSVVAPPSPPVAPNAVSAEPIAPKAVEGGAAPASAPIDGDPTAVSTDSRESHAVPTESRGGAVSETNIRIDVGLLDKLMNLVGELVLARNQMLQFNSSEKDPAFLSTTQRLNLITSELQESVMKTRMQPIGNVWNRFPRVVRDLALACGKQVRLEMEGNHTELDKTIVEAIKDPMTHIVRNSIDHGIETADVRTAAGKPAVGTLLLRAFHEGGQVNIEIIDDGAGVNTERVKAKALQRGLITRELAARMSDREATHLLFLPGFSTAEKVTNVSGRGVGMDVVKTNIERIGGTVDIQSQAGKGTTIKIKIPLTLAIIPALIVTSGGDRFAIPQVSLLELVRLEADQVRKGIERIHGTPVYRLRGNLLPLVYLNHELNNEPPQIDRCETVNIVVLQADDRQFGLVVDGIIDTEEIVVKPLGKALKSIPVFAGATIMGDGRVALILDVLGIAQRSGVVSEVRDRMLSEASSDPADRRNEKKTLLLLGLGTNRRAAIPLSMVDRLEEIPATEVERADEKEVVQYRGQILPLIRLADLLGAERAEETGPQLQVVVYSEGDRSVGLVVDRILDIVETTLDVHRATGHEGVVASAVIQHRVTDLLDVQGIIRSVDPRFSESASAV